ncbi:MarR family winged helix-turn-helix transcriptional regulator [Blastopirellula marina]|uniref:Regulatory protein, MarR n=1 Tax=Blastopirellula marina DSM 3645 TaxID=314230 RepID=A3ZXC9_9BACT|nr:MarR family transcriptional regulator [Blastopirellula marina]EAQ78830.1 regulatory protein, MarR [Blastopirellula marina DSM 3645]
MPFCRDNSLSFQLGVAMRRVARLYTEELAPFQLTPPQLYLLTCLEQNAGCKPREIARSICVDASSITSLLDRSEQAGLIQRQADPADRRSLQIFLTDLGRRRLATVAETVEALNQRIRDELLAPFNDEQVDLFLTMLRGIGKDD